MPGLSRELISPATTFQAHDNDSRRIQLLKLFDAIFFVNFNQKNIASMTGVNENAHARNVQVKVCSALTEMCVSVLSGTTIFTDANI